MLLLLFSMVKKNKKIKTLKLYVDFCLIYHSAP